MFIKIRIIVMVCGMILLISPLAQKSFGSAQLTESESEEDQGHELICPKEDSYGVKDKGKNKKLQICYSPNGSQNGDIYVMLEEGKKSRCVLTAGGSAAGFVRRQGVYPDVGISWHFSAADNPSTLYVWNGHEYEEQSAKSIRKQAKKALELYKTGKVEEAIKAWEEAYKQSPASLSAEDYNNLGFAYYTLGKRGNSPDRFSNAHKYLDIALQAQPKRWTAHLNLGDLYAAENMFSAAIEEYKKVLELRPDYKHAAALRDKISQLKLEPRKIGVEVVAMRHPEGEKDITYTRLDEHKVMQRGYFQNGKTRFEVILVDGAEDGPYRSWFDNGQPAVIGTRRMGKAVGTWEYFDWSGKISQVLVHYPDGSTKDVTPKKY